MNRIIFGLLVLLGFSMAVFLNSQQIPVTTNGIPGQIVAMTQVSTTTMGGSLLTLGIPATSTVSVTGALVGMGCNVVPSTGSVTNSVIPVCYVSAANTVTVQLYGFTAVTPTAQVYNVRLFQ